MEEKINVMEKDVIRMELVGLQAAILKGNEAILKQATKGSPMTVEHIGVVRLAAKLAEAEEEIENFCNEFNWTLPSN